MKTLGVIALVLGLAFVIAGLAFYVLDRAALRSDEPTSDEETPETDDADRDLPMVDDPDVKAGMRQPRAAEVRDAAQAAATHIVGN